MPIKRLADLEENNYDPRWFIWTVVFLIVSGVSLVSYILITTSNDYNDIYIPIVHNTRVKAE